MQVTVTNLGDHTKTVCRNQQAVYQAVLKIIGSMQVACIVSGWASHAPCGDNWTLHNVDVRIEDDCEEV